MSALVGDVEKVKAALAEVLASRDVFSEGTYTQIVLALSEKIRQLQTFSSQESTPVGDTDEIRQVTVMFVDVKDSTLLAQRLESDDWKLLIAESQRLVAQEIGEWDGEIGQYLGDGMLCFFGAHRSHGDEALRAVSCALAIQQTMQSYGRRVQQRYQFEFALRIGISTGKVVVGMLGTAQKREFLALGSSTNLAARLQSLCPPGGVMIDSETYQHVQNYVVAQAQTPAEVKGFDELVEHYLVLRRQQQPAVNLTTNHNDGVTMPFVGREDELAQIMSLSARALDHHEFYAVTIYGEVGVGKSRLLQEALAKVTGTEFNLLSMVAHYEKRGTSYSLLRDLLASRCNLSDETPASAAEQAILEHIHETWSHPYAEATSAMLGFVTGYGFDDSPYVLPLKGGGPERQRIAMEWLAMWFRGMAESGPLLITVDNLEWADATSLDFLEYLAQDLSGCGGILLGTARRDFRFQRPTYLRGHPRHTEIKLGPLSQEATSALIEAELQRVENVPEPLLPLILERAEGNPLFVEEFLRMLFEGGVFEQEGSDRWKVNHFRYATLASLPSGLLGILQARLDDLPGSARRILQVASVLGQTFWEGAASQLAGFDSRTILMDLETRGIIRVNLESSFEGEQEYAFRHTLYREVAYSMLVRANREAYHRQAAQWLLERVADRSDYLDGLAEHYVNGQQREQAMAIYVAAAEERIGRGLLAEALKLIENGLAAAREVPREIALPLVSKLWVLQGKALNSLDRYREASAASQTALMLMEELPPKDMIQERITAGCILGNAYCSLGQYDEASVVLFNAYEMLADQDDRQRSAVMRAFGRLFWARGELLESLSYNQQAFQLVQDGGDPRQEASTLAMFGRIALDRGDMATALGYFERVLKINQPTNNLYYQILDMRHIGEVYRLVHADNKALAMFDQAEALQARIRYRDPLLNTNRGLCLIALGEGQDGLALLREVAGIDHQNAYTRQYSELALLQGLALCGDYAGCVEKAQRYVEATRDLNPILHGRALLWMGYAQHALKQPEASETLRLALDKELYYAGRDLWLCHYLLAQTIADALLAREHYHQASETVHALAASLAAFPDLQQSLLEYPLVKSVIAAHQPTDAG